MCSIDHSFFVMPASSVRAGDGLSIFTPLGVGMFIALRRPSRSAPFEGAEAILKNYVRVAFRSFERSWEVSWHSGL